MGDRLQQAASQPEGFLLYEGGKVAEELRRSVTHIRVAPHVRKIPDLAFRGCDKLIDLQLNEGLQVIGERAFYGCGSLLNVKIPSSLTKLGQWAFSYCSGLIVLQLEGGVQSIGDYAFSYCAALRHVTLPPSVAAIGEGAFCRCSRLVELQLKEGLQDIGSGAFEGCKSLRSVTLPSSLINLGDGAFFRCSGLIELRVNEGLQVIGGGAFQDCTELQSVALPSSITNLGDDAFCGCTNLARVSLNKGLRIIGEAVFGDCTALRSVTVPSTVTELGACAFCDCTSLYEVILLGGRRLLNLEFVNVCVQREEQEQGLLDREALDEMLLDEDREFIFSDCLLNDVKVSISWAVTERMARLPHECMLSVEEKIHNMRRLELQQDGNVLACFPVVDSRVTDDEAQDKTFEVRDTNNETARSLHQVLQLIAFHELKESSIVIELAMWMSRIDGTTTVQRANCRVAVPDPAKILIMEYCGFAGFLEPAIEGA
ncbi:hypothetical protein THAOC_05559 [Thalassiosira oceanica]|uniref:Leucine-rich repeat protein n=1 Tax=Thalassiosira oceanica TaxID=159749 RepID=K0TMP6_THAOC|nr:hypothetical protein THAOC_05559 [Thalassiosira oceanica]|eukprot:EJK72867.1 hypothetical protein THAOC_05559 [Thalassiosira oceanica]